MNISLDDDFSALHEGRQIDGGAAEREGRKDWPADDDHGALSRLLDILIDADYESALRVTLLASEGEAST